MKTKKLIHFALRNAKSAFLLLLTILIISTAKADNCAFPTEPKPTLELTSPTPVTNGLNCTYTLKLTFTITYSNSGEKFINIHFWNGVLPSSWYSPTPVAGASGALSNSIGTISFDVNSTTKDLTSLTSYAPDNTVTTISINPANITKTLVSGTTYTYSITGIPITIPCADAAAFEAGVWSSNSGSGNAVHCYTAGAIILPVHFGNIKASNKNGKVTIDFQTLMEKNAKEFVVEASKDGKEWKALGKLDTKAPNGNTDQTQSYQLVIDSSIALGAVSLALLLFVPVFRSRLLRATLGVVALTLIFIACNKQSGDEVDVNKKDTLYIRIAQYDINSDRPTYSKTIKVVNE